jgi:pimeloyl-ACP methyl ester carboxylesterase
MEIRRVPAGAVTLEVAEAGNGGRPLLLVHGFTGAKEDFGELLDDLAGLGWHAVAPDQRGHGNSDKPPGENAYSPPIFVADLLALADSLGWARFTAFGYSMGGMFVQRLVLDHPERVDALVFLDTSHGVPESLDRDAVALGGEIVRDHGLLTLLALQNERRERDPTTTAAHLRLLRERPGWAEFGDRKLLACSADMWLSMTRAILDQEDRLDALHAVRVPTLVMVGEQDDAFLPHCERIAKAIPGARLVVIPDAGHAPQFENTPAFWDALTSFLEEVPAR